MSFTSLVHDCYARPVHLASSLWIGTIKHAQLAAIAHNREVVARLRARSKLPGMFSYTALRLDWDPLVNYADSYAQCLEQSEYEIRALKDWQSSCHDLAPSDRAYVAARSLTRLSEIRILMVYSFCPRGITRKRFQSYYSPQSPQISQSAWSLPKAWSVATCGLSGYHSVFTTKLLGFSICGEKYTQRIDMAYCQNDIPSKVNTLSSW